MNKHGHFGYAGNTEIVGEREDGSFILSEDADDRWPYGNCQCEWCSSERELHAQEEKDKADHKVNLLQKTLNWFNAQFGTGLETLDCGEPGSPSSCVLAMTLKKHVNPNFQWNVSGSSISIANEQKVNTSALPELCPNILVGEEGTGYHIQGIPVETGGAGSLIETREEEPWPRIYRDYDIIDSTVEVVKADDFPSYVQEFIHKFDDKEYEELLDDEWKDSNGY